MLQASGAIKLSQVRTELDVLGAVSLGAANSRSLANVASGAIKLTNFYGKYRELAQIDAYIFDNTAQFNSFTSSFVPPTMQQVFDTWGRFAANTWFPSGTTPTGEAAAWQFNSTLQRPECTQNTANYTGFISNDKLGDYTFEATLSSTNGDDDLVGLVAAFKNDGVNNIGIFVSRTAGGLGITSNWMMQLSNAGAVSTLINGSNAASAVLNTAPNTGPGWAGSGVTRIKIQKTGNVLSAVCSPFGSTTYNDTTAMTFDLTSNATTALLTGKQSYGYVAYSQIASTYTDISMKGALAFDKVFDTSTGVVKQYNTTTQQWDVLGSSISANLGYPRKVYNPDTGALFFIDPYGVITRLS